MKVIREEGKLPRLQGNIFEDVLLVLLFILAFFSPLVIIYIVIEAFV